MTDNTQPLALMLADRLHHEQPTVLRIDAEHAGEELRRQHARIAELEAQLEAIGAGGVSSPLMGCASIAASAGSEPVIGWHAFPHYLQHPDGRLLRTASDLLARHGYHGCAEPLRAMSDALLPTNPSPPEGMVMVPKEPTHHMLNAAASAYKDARQSLGAYYAPWAAYRAMLEVAAPPTTPAGSEKGE